MSKQLKWTFVGVFFAAGAFLILSMDPPLEAPLPRELATESGSPAQSASGNDMTSVVEFAAAATARQGVAGTPASQTVARLHSAEVAPHHLVNPVTQLTCENPENGFDCRLVIINDHPYYDSARFSSKTLETLAANYDPVAALVLAQRFSLEREKRIQYFLDAATYSGRAGPLVTMLRDFENDPTDPGSVVDRCKYLYVATWMGYPFGDDGRILSRACEDVVTVGAAPQAVREDAKTLFSRMESKRQATLGKGLSSGGGAS